MGFQPKFAPRILVIERDEAQRIRISDCAKQISEHVRVRSVGSLEWAVDMLHHEEFDLILVASDLGRGTQAFTSVVTLMGAGTRATIAVHCTKQSHGEGLALESIGICNYLPVEAINLQALHTLVGRAPRAAVA